MADPLRMVTIYDHPRDYPGHWVVRECFVDRSAIRFAPDAALFEHIDGARDHIRTRFPGMVRVQGPGEDPDPVVFEVYV